MPGVILRLAQWCILRHMLSSHEYLRSSDKQSANAVSDATHSILIDTLIQNLYTDGIDLSYLKLSCTRQTNSYRIHNVFRYEQMIHSKYYDYYKKNVYVNTPDTGHIFVYLISTHTMGLCAMSMILSLQCTTLRFVRGASSRPVDISSHLRVVPQNRYHTSQHSFAPCIRTLSHDQILLASTTEKRVIYNKGDNEDIDGACLRAFLCLYRGEGHLIRMCLCVCLRANR